MQIVVFTFVGHTTFGSLLFGCMIHSLKFLEIWHNYFNIYVTECVTDTLRLIKEGEEDDVLGLDRISAENIIAINYNQRMQKYPNIMLAMVIALLVGLMEDKVSFTSYGCSISFGRCQHEQ